MHAICCLLFQSASSSSASVFCTYSMADRSPASSLTIPWLIENQDQGHQVPLDPASSRLRQERLSTGICWLVRTDVQLCMYAPVIAQHLDPKLHYLKPDIPVLGIHIRGQVSQNTQLPAKNPSHSSQCLKMTAKTFSAPWPQAALQAGGALA